MENILLVVKKILFILVEIVHSIVLPETSLPIWIRIIGLEWWLSFLLVATLGSLPMFLIFWPKQTARILSMEKREKIEVFLKKLLSWLKNWVADLMNIMAGSIKSLAKKGQKEKGERLTAWKFFLGYLILPFVLAIDFIISIKNWLRRQNRLLISALKGFGYLGVIAGAGFPGALFPFVFGIREAGMAVVFAIGNWQAKVLFILTELIRLFIEAWLIRK